MIAINNNALASKHSEKNSFKNLSLNSLVASEIHKHMRLHISFYIPFMYIYLSYSPCVDNNKKCENYLFLKNLCFWKKEAIRFFGTEKKEKQTKNWTLLFYKKMKLFLRAENKALKRKTNIQIFKEKLLWLFKSIFLNERKSLKAFLGTLIQDLFYKRRNETWTLDFLGTKKMLQKYEPFFMGLLSFFYFRVSERYSNVLN